MPAFIALAAALLSIAVIAWLTYRSLEARAEAAEAINHTNDVQDQLHRFLSMMKDAETGQRGFLLTGEDSYLAPYNLAIAAVPDEIAKLRKITADNPGQQQRLDIVAPLVRDKLEELAETIRIRRTGDTAGALTIVRSDRGKIAMDHIREQIDTMLSAEQMLLVQRTDAWEATVRSSSYVVFGGIGVVFGMVILLGYLASRDYRLVSSATWARRVQLILNDELQGDLHLESIGEKVLRVLVEHLHARVGAMYVIEAGGQLRRIAGHALLPSAQSTASIRVGEGMTGQAAIQSRLVHLRDLPTGYLEVGSTVGKAVPREVVIAPARVDDVLQAVTELGFLRSLDSVEIDALDRMSESIARAIRSAREHARLVELLEEVQRQTEELQSQEEELRSSNEELEQQAQVLQVSQAQLERQQAELEQINAQLEEQAQSLAIQRDELQRASAELQRSNEIKSQFLANMSHELRTPLNSSLILARLLSENRDGNLTAEQVKFAQTIYSAGNDLLILINDILDLSKIEAGMLDVRSELVTIPRLVDELVRTFQPVAATKGLELVMQVDDAPGQIETDATRLSQILRNLLSNALKFTERGKVTLVITAVDANIQFAVHDTGIGIAADQHELVFEAFRQADGATTRKFGGTGLGLSISRDLARLLGGDLAIASAPGQGSVFTLSLPRRTNGVRAVPQLPAPTPIIGPRRTTRAVPVVVAGPGAIPDDRERTNTAARTLLIVEDDAAFAGVLADLAHELEFLALVASTADDGIAMARRYLPSAIVLDVGLPDRSGLAVLDSLKRDPTTRHIPVHVVSASDYSRSALEMGAAGYALKPVDREQLTDALRQLEAKFTQKLRRVLIVEDDPVLRDSTARLLGGDDVETSTAGTTAEALALLASTTFDCMVLDLALPDGSGLALLEDMARGEQYSFPPVIVYTGRPLSPAEVYELERFSSSIIIKGARSPERLVDEVTLFLHQVEAKLPPERQRMLRDARSREAVFEGRRILVVEDDVRNVFALASVLEPRGAVVEIARNGREALDHLHSRPGVDLVLMDIMMPEMDGIEATRALRADPRFTKLPIIALTAKAMIDDREKCLAAGANDYIAKPLDLDKLLSLARVWMRA